MSIDDMIDELRGLATLPERAAAIAAPMLEQKLRATAAAGTTPDGKPWAKTKTGAQAMPNAASAISAKALGSVVRVTLEGPEVFHHYGVRGAPARKVIPDTGVDASPAIKATLDQAFGLAFESLTGGR